MEITIRGITLTTERPLPDEVRKYMEHWAAPTTSRGFAKSIAEHAPSSLIEKAVAKEFEPELRRFAELFEAHQLEIRNQNTAFVTDLITIKEVAMGGRVDVANAYANIAIAEQLQHIAVSLEAIARALESRTTTTTTKTPTTTTTTTTTTTD